MAAQPPSGGNEALLAQRRLDDGADVRRPQAQELRARAGEEGVDGGARLADFTTAQARLEIEDRARRRHEEVAGDQRLADAAARRAFQAYVGAQGAAAPGQRGADQRVVDLRGVQHLDEGVGADLVA